MKSGCAVLLLIWICGSSPAAEKPLSAIEQFHNLQAKLKASHDAKDWPSNLTAAIAQKELLNASPNTLLEVARAEMHVGDTAAALREVETFVRMGQSTELFARSPDFAAMRSLPEFAKIQIGMDANVRPIARGELAFAFPAQDPDLLAEDVDYDSAGHRFLVTSVREKKIVALDAHGNSVEFAKSPDNWPMMALKVDRSHRLLWATEVALQGFTSAPAADWGRSAILCYDLKSGKLLRRVEGPPKSALGDMALLKNGDVVVSDGDGGGVYRLPAKATTLERLDNGDFISPQTIAVAPDGKHIFVPDYLRGIAVLDVSTKDVPAKHVSTKQASTKYVRWLPTSGQFALNGIDGLYFDRGRGQLIAIQNGTSPERVIAFTLDAAFSKIESETVIERSSKTLGDPTHGVVVGKDFYYLANSGWDRMDDHGDFQLGTKASPPLMMRVELAEIR